MLLDVLIPTNGQLSKLQPLMESISAQTLQPDRVVVLIHKILQKEELEILQYFLQRSCHPELAAKITIICNLTAEYRPGRGVGYDRNQLIRYAKAKFLYMIDHDNIFREDLFEKTVDAWVKIKEELQKDILLSPTIMRRQTAKVQSQGITWFSFLIPKYIYRRMWGELRQTVKMVWANSLFGPKKIFEAYSFDDRFARSYEDIDFSYRVQQWWTPVIVLNKVEIYHMEATKNKLETLFLWNRASAYERARNRILFVKKVATWRQKTLYFGCGLRLQTVWFLLNILLYGKKQRLLLRWAVLQGTRDGLRS